MRRFAPTALLAASALCLLVAPLAMPETYSWVEHGVSESAAQGVANAWIARIGFLLFGIAVLWLAPRCADHWQQPGTALLFCFALSMFGVAAFSARSWDETAPWDRTADTLHSVFATTVGISFIGGVTSVIIARAAISGTARSRLHSLRSAAPARDVVPLAIACAVPLLMASAAWGLLQRLMFAAAYGWFMSYALSPQTERRPQRSSTMAPR